MSKEEQLSWEARVGRPVAIACFAAALLLIAALIYSSSTLNQRTHDTVSGLRVIHDHTGPVIATTVLQALSTALLAAPLWFLYQVARFRRPEVPPVARYLALLAPPLAGVISIVRQVQVADVADKVVNHLSTAGVTSKAANDYAKDQLGHGDVQFVGGLGLAAGLALAFAFVLISMNAMRAGLLSRFMGILGIVVGVLFVIPLFGSVPVVELFWVAALGALFLGRWPQGGRGPAWDAGEVVPWPTAQQRQEERLAARAERDAEREEAPARPRRQPVTAGRGAAPEPEAEPDGDGAAPAPQRPAHPRSRKRKRKRR